MRIIAGRFGGRRLAVPKAGVRPTTDRVKESMFAMLQARVDFDDADVLDLYAGSGNLGFEALSRGARRVVFVERSRDARDCIRSNADKLGVSDQVTIDPAAVSNYLARAVGGDARSSFDIALADPPYDEPIDTLPDLVAPLLRAGGTLAIEHESGMSFEDHPNVETYRDFGGTRVSFFHYQLRRP